MPFVPFSEEEIAQQKRKQKPKVYEAARFVPFTDAELAARRGASGAGALKPVYENTLIPQPRGQTRAQTSGKAVSTTSHLRRSALPTEPLAQTDSETGLTSPLLIRSRSPPKPKWIGLFKICRPNARLD